MKTARIGPPLPSSRDSPVEARRRQRELFDTALRHRPGQDYADTLTAAWSILTGEQAHRYIRLFAAVHALPPAEVPWNRFPAMAVHDWLPTIEEGLRADGYPQPHALATLILAVARGLLLDECATAEHERATAAYAAFMTMLRSRQSARPPA